MFKSKQRKTESIKKAREKIAFLPKRIFKKKYGERAMAGCLVACIFLVCSGLMAKTQRIVIFEANDANLTRVSSKYKETTYKIDNSVLTLNPQLVNKEYGNGIDISGQWNLADYNELEIQLVNYETSSVQVNIALTNKKTIDTIEDAGILISKMFIPAREEKTITVIVPNGSPDPSVSNRFTGMRSGPYNLANIEPALKPEDIGVISVYVDRSNATKKWGIKKISARQNATAKVLPEWIKQSSKNFFPFIDQYGQFIHIDWPGKKKSDADFKNDLKKESEYLQAHPGPAGRSRFGGWADGPRQAATGSFYVKKISGKWWMVDPEGYLFWSHGVVRVTPSCAITPLDGREFYFKDLPDKNSPFYQFYSTRDTLLHRYYTARGIEKTYDFSAANIYRKYGDDWRNRFADMAHQRLKSWGLNTIANGSDASIYLMRRTPYCDRLELKSPDIEASKSGWWKFKDPFHPEFIKSFREQLLSKKNELDDPWCLGFFVDNEIAWGGPTSLAEWSLQSPATQPVKKEMIAQLKRKYTTIQKLNTAWGSVYKSWDDMLRSEEKPPAGSKQDCIDFSKVITEKYFKTIREEFKKVAPHKLYMGCRFIGEVSESITRIAAKYCDVLSYNRYRVTLKNFSLPAGVDKPVIIGEFHFGALDRGMFHPGLVKTANQTERGEAYKRFVESSLQNPLIVGTHWHQFSDQATTGRFDGENFQVGLTDVCDHPYTETIDKVREVGYSLYSTRMKTIQ